MSLSSRLANDRRWESYWLCMVTLVLLVQFIPMLMKSHFMLSLVSNFLGLIGIFSIFMGGFWSLLRAARLSTQRPWYFNFILMFFGLISFVFVLMLLAYLNWPELMYEYYAYGLGVSFVFLLIVGWQVVCSFMYLMIKPARKGLQKLGLSVHKPLHLLVLGISILAYCFHLKSMAFALFGIGYYLGIRYGYNRWIFMVSSRFPFDEKTSKRFIQKAASETA